MPEKPAIVIALGAWHRPVHMELLRQELEQAGYEVAIPEYPSVGGKRPSKDGLGDFEAIHNAAKQYIDAGNNVCLVMFSYGGIAGTGGSHGLRPQDTANGKGIVSLVYIAAFVPEAGQGTYSILGGGHAPWCNLHKDAGAGGWAFPNKPPFEPGQLFYNDCSSEVQDEQVANLRVWSEAASHSGPPSATWKDIESNYLICELDQALPASLQETHFANREGGKWKHIEKIQAGHSPFLSKPKETAIFIGKCAGESL